MYQRITFKNYTPTLGEVERMGIPIFNDWWTTHVPEYRPILERKILHAFHFNQIAAETPDRFIYDINAQLERIMPYYNQLYASELIKIDPLLNHSVSTNGRTIENLLNHVNTVDDAVSKSIRDFTGLTDRFGTDTGNVKSNTSTVSDSTENTQYHKQGNEKEEEDRDLTGTEDETTARETTTDTKSTITYNTNVNVDGTVTTDKEVTEVPDEKTVKTMDWGANETGKEDTVGKDVSADVATKNWTETIDDDATTDTVTNLSENTSSAERKDYADTPQKELNTGSTGVGFNDAGMPNIRQNYLTNVTWDNAASSHTADTTQNVTYKDDQTKTHKEDTTDDLTVDKTKTVDTHTQKGGTDVETSVHTGNNVTTTHGTEKTLSDTKKTGDDTTVTHTVENQDTVRHLDTTEKEHTERNKDWSEDGNKDVTTLAHSVTDHTADTVNTSKGNTNTRELSNISKSDSKENTKHTEETTDTGTTQISSGFMNVSSSALLEAFRRTFLNIDDMIIEDLKSNFQMVY